MNILFLLKLLNDLALYWTFADLIFPGVGAFSLVLLCMAGCLAAMAVALPLRNKGWLRFLPLALTALPLPFVQSPWAVLFWAGPAAYTGHLIALRRHSVQADEALGRFPACAVAGAIACGFCLLAGHPARYALPYVLFWISNVFLLRLLRLQQSGALTRRHIAQHVVALLLLFVVCGVFSAPVLWQAITQGIDWLYQQLVAPVLIGAFYGIFWLVTQLGILIGRFWQPDWSRAAQDDSSTPHLDQEQPEFVQGEMSQATFIFLVVAAVILFVLVALWLFRRLAGHEALEESRAARDTCETAVPMAKAPSPRGHRASVRRSYRRVLAFLKAREPELNAASTSEDVARAGQRFAPTSPNEELRELYRRARYDEAAEITAKDRRRARALAAEITRPGASSDR